MATLKIDSYIFALKGGDLVSGQRWRLEDHLGVILAKGECELGQRDDALDAVAHMGIDGDVTIIHTHDNHGVFDRVTSTVRRTDGGWVPVRCHRERLGVG